jgi:hypothetical protein
VSEFLRILSEIEKRSEPPSGGHAFRISFGAAPLRGPAPDAFATEGIVAAYLRASGEHSDKAAQDATQASAQKAREADVVGPYDAVCFEKDLLEARGCPKRLKALRRKIAWRLHPDRGRVECDVFPADLAKCNAQIDAAIANCDS